MALGAALQRFIDWFWRDCLPLWAERGADAEGGFWESLSFEGMPVAGEPRRVRVQGRQVHVFATAARLGRLPKAEGLARRGFDYLRSRGCPDGGRRGCFHILGPDGGVIDSRRDLYDQAFLLLACASMRRAFGDNGALCVARSVANHLDRELRGPGGGFLEDDRGGKPRRQNPHMHLFEAMTALAGVDGAFAPYADEFFRLFERRFLDRKAGVLREFFIDDLSAPDPAKGDILEPGHMAEWVWLLETRFAHSGESRNPARDAQRLLYRRAVEIGEDQSGFLVDAVRLGEKPSGARRLWPQTEYLKASLVMARNGEAGAVETAERLVRALFDTYLDQDVKGLWCDAFDGEGRAIAKSVPASIVYHLMEAALEAEKHLKETQ